MPFWNLTSFYYSNHIILIKKTHKVRLSSVFVNTFNYCSVVVENLMQYRYFYISIIYSISHMKMTTSESNRLFENLSLKILLDAVFSG